MRSVSRMRGSWKPYDGAVGRVARSATPAESRCLPSSQPALPVHPVSARAKAAEAMQRALRGAFLVVPAFNEGLVIHNVISGLLATFPNVIVVNDGSSDDTAAVLRTLPVTAVTHPVNLGQGAAL